MFKPQLPKIRKSIRGPNQTAETPKVLPQFSKILRDNLPKGMLPVNPLKKPRKK